MEKSVFEGIQASAGGGKWDGAVGEWVPWSAPWEQSQEGSPAVLHHAGHLWHEVLIENWVLLLLGVCSVGPGREGSVFHF